MKKDKNNIELVVFNCFIRAIKDDGKYMIFRKSVTNSGIMKALAKPTIIRSDNPFSSSSSTSDIVRTLERITNDMAKSNGKKRGIEDLDKYEHVTMTINHLLHFFMESNGISMDKLCSMGEEIYGHSCFKLFGDTIEDIEKQQEEEVKNVPDEHLKAKLFQEYIVGIQSGKISSKVSFDEYLKKHLPKFRNEDSSDDFIDIAPQILGRRPEDNEFMRAINPSENSGWGWDDRR